MKKVILVLAAVAMIAGLTSCKKDYTCTCTFSASSGNPTLTIPFNGYTKKDATNACDAAATTYASAGGTGCTLN